MIPITLFQAATMPLILAAGIILGLYAKGFERVLTARMQGRIGPPLRQPFRDIRKLMMKETIIPRDAVRWLFNASPVIALSMSLLLLLYLPVLGLDPVLGGHGDMILVLYLLVLPSLALVMGGMASGSPYATVGAQREMVKMMSYEFPLSVAVITIAWMLSVRIPGISAFSLAAITGTPAWGVAGPVGMLGIALLFAVTIFVIPGKLGRLPFDASEAETEIAEGVLAEYSGRNLALFELAEAVKTVAMASLVIALFIPYGISGWMGLAGIQGMTADALFFIAKFALLVFIGPVVMGAGIARLRVTQIVRAYWGYGTALALTGMLLIAMELLLG